MIVLRAMELPIIQPKDKPGLGSMGLIRSNVNDWCLIFCVNFCIYMQGLCTCVMYLLEIF